MVEYSLTPLGRSLIEPLEAICRWAEKHLPELEAARERAQNATREREASTRASELSAHRHSKSRVKVA